MTEVSAPVMSEDEAERITRRIALVAGTVRESMEKLHALVDEAKRGNAHVALGYRSWTEYLAEVLGAQPLRLEREERRELVGYLAGEGMSTRAIAPIVGAASHDTVARDLREAGVRNRTPESTPEPEVDLSKVDRDTGEIRDDDPAESLPEWRQRKLREAEETGNPIPITGPGSVADPAPKPAQKVTGRDGKQYTRPTPKAEPSKPRRAPLTDGFFKAAYDLRKNVERLERLVNDDRFPQNREQVALRHENDLNRTAEALAGVLRAISNR